jgi:uncharacterized spore protein YtfJ
MAEVNIANNINTLFENLEKVLTTKTVFGEAITVGGTTLIPVIDIRFGLGTCGGAGDAPDKGAGSGYGGGTGGCVTASAVIVIRGEDVQVMQIKKSTNVGKLVEMIPEIMDKIKPCMEKGEGKKTEVKVETTDD